MTKLTENLLAVEVPEGASNFEICNYGLNDALEYDYPQGHEVSDLPPGNWQLLCTTKEATEEQAKGVVPMIVVRNCDEVYEDYITPGDHYYYEALTSLRSLLTSKGLDGNKNYVLLKKM